MWTRLRGTMQFITTIATTVEIVISVDFIRHLDFPPPPKFILPIRLRGDNRLGPLKADTIVFGY